MPLIPFTPEDACSLVSDPTSTLCGNFTRTLLQLPVKFCQLITALFTDTGDLKPEVISQVLPPGLIMMSGTTDPPTGWLTCNGQEVSRTTYANLFAAIGETFGAGNGTTTFLVPDMRDRFPGGVSGTVALASTGGATEFELNLDHKHAVGQFDNAGGDKTWLVINSALTIQDSTSTRQLRGGGSDTDVQNYGDISPAPESDIIATEKQEWDGSATLTVDTVSPYLALGFIIKT